MRQAPAPSPGLFNAAPLPVQPWDYIRLRRQAAGLSIEQAARHFSQSDERLPACIANIRSFETAGVRVKNIEGMKLDRAVPFDPSVYVQLRDDPPSTHPRLCSGCGCSSWTACHCSDGGECRIEDGLCTRCREKAEWMARSERRAA